MFGMKPRRRWWHPQPPPQPTSLEEVASQATGHFQHTIDGGHCPGVVCVLHARQHAKRARRAQRAGVAAG